MQALGAMSSLAKLGLKAAFQNGERRTPWRKAQGAPRGVRVAGAGGCAGACARSGAVPLAVQLVHGLRAVPLVRMPIACLKRRWHFLHANSGKWRGQLVA